MTGSCYWIRAGAYQFLVDCGMFQGSKTIKELNYGAFPFDPAKIDFVFLTHAHTDHAGLMPKLIKLGFEGPIYTTAGTNGLLTYMLPDSAYIQEMEVDRLNRRNRQRGKAIVEPIYNHGHVDQCLSQIRAVDYDHWLELDQLRARFWNAGHILGAASIELEVPTGDPAAPVSRLLFSGDIGPDHKLFHPDPEAPHNVDYLICESTYGGRRRVDVSPIKRRALLAREINDAMKAGGALIIPAFAVERTQELLLDLSYLLNSGDIPNLPVFLDSPLAIKVTSVFAEHADDLEDVASRTAPFGHSSFHFTETVEESKAIARFSGGVIIVAASGMCDAGRIRHHLKNHLWRPKSTVLLVGYQAEGTLGRLLEQGAKKVKIQGEEIDVRARIHTLDTYSGHADGDGLIDWVRERLPVKQAIFLTHGGAAALKAMFEQLTAQELSSARLIIPALDDEFDLTLIEDGPQQSKGIRRLDPRVVDKPDWHNDLAQLTLDIRTCLDNVSSNKKRTAILKGLRQALERDK